MNRHRRSLGMCISLLGAVPPSHKPPEGQVAVKKARHGKVQPLRLQEYTVKRSHSWHCHTLWVSSKESAACISTQSSFPPSSQILNLGYANEKPSSAFLSIKNWLYTATMRYQSHRSEWLSFKSLQIKILERMWRKGNPLTLLVRM